MKLDRLYKTDSKGKVRIIDIEVEDNKFRTISGLEDGKLVTSDWTVCTPKNIGKTNETTSAEQALAEATASHDKKLKEHYTLDKTIALSGDRKYFEVMLATDKDKIKDYPSFPYIADYKLDGMRLTVSSEKACSRKGTDVPAASHIVKIVKSLCDSDKGLTLDGELYNHSLKNDFEHLMHLARSQSFTIEERKECDSTLQFHIYDVAFEDHILENASALTRKELVKQYVALLDNPSIVEVHSELVNNQEELDAFEMKALSLGYEGVILRHPDMPYIHKRTKYLIKVKQFITEEFIITDIVEGEGNRSGKAGAIWIQKSSGSKVKCGIRGSHEYCEQLLENRKFYIGKQATVRHFGHTKDDSLRFPICIDINRKE